MTVTLRHKLLFISGYILLSLIGFAYSYFNQEPEQTVSQYFLTKLANHQNIANSFNLEPTTLLDTYPGLKSQDFQSVSANGGKYILQGGTISFVADRNKTNQANSKQINEAGAQLLLRNLSRRTNLAVTTSKEIDVLLSSLSQNQSHQIVVKKTLTIEGLYVCIPPKPNFANESTCVQGIKTSDTNYYALDLAPLETIAILQTGNQIRAEGEVVPVETLSGDKWQKYPIKGIFRAVTIKNL